MGFKDTKRFGITWVDGRMYSNDTMKSIKSWIGVCHRTKHVCKLASIKDQITPLIIRDTYVDIKDKSCEENHRCLDFSCDLNKTDVKDMARMQNKKRFNKENTSHYQKKIDSKTPPMKEVDFSEYINEDGESRIVTIKR